MATDVIVRGNLVHWTANFLDEDGAAIDPDSVELVVNYPSGTSRAHEAITMEDDDGWKGSWDSAVASPGRVYWSMRAVPTAVEDGFFDVTANKANLDT